MFYNGSQQIYKRNEVKYAKCNCPMCCITDLMYTKYVTVWLHSLHQNWIQFYCRSLQTHSISIHPQCIKCLMSTDLLSWGNFSDPPKSRLKQWHQWRVPNGQWGPGFAPTDSVAHWYVIAVWKPWLLMGCPKWEFLPPYTPSHPPHLLAIPTAEKDGKKPWNLAISHRG